MHRYVADERFGGPSGLAAARAALAARGVRLILDYVPNHVAPDHPWVTEHPEYFIQGDDDDVKADPAGWLAVGGHVLAHGRDPYFPPWPDVVQLNAYAAAARAATAQTLSDIAGQCDGIRCDMAMLMTNDIFGKTWGDRAGQRPDEEFWPAIIAELRTRHPDTVLIAEAYWDMEWTLQQQGFAFCYDKRLYDRILEVNPPDLRGHLQADLGYQSRLVRFLENHDEPRIADKLPAVLERAAAVTIATLPGATLWHEGQFEGRRVRPPSSSPGGPTSRSTRSWPPGTAACSVVAKQRGANGGLAAARGRGLARQPVLPQPDRLVVDARRDDADDVRRHVVVVNLSVTRPRARSGFRGRTWPAVAGACLIRSAGRLHPRRRRADRPRALRRPAAGAVLPAGGALTEEGADMDDDEADQPPPTVLLMINSWQATLMLGLVTIVFGVMHRPSERLAARARRPGRHRRDRLGDLPPDPGG